MTKIIRTLGWIALLGGAVRAAMTPCALYWGAGSVQELSAGVIGSILLTIGTFGIYLHQAEAMGRYGMPVFYLVTFGNILTTLLVSLSLNDVLHGRGADAAPIFPFDLVILLNMLLMIFGHVLFGSLSFRAGKLPRWAGILLILTPAALFVPGLADWSAGLWGLAYMGFGLKVVLAEQDWEVNYAKPAH